MRFGLLARVRDSDLGDGVRIGSGSIVMGTAIGALSYLGHHCTLLHVTIGRFCSISWQVSVLGHGAHPVDRLSTHQFPYNPAFGLATRDGTDVERRETSIGSDCWIGAGATILPGVRVGDGCIVGAGSIVTRDLADFSVAAGNPARVVRLRFDEPTRELLQEIRWWNWPIERVREHLALFESPPRDLAAFRDALRAAAGLPAGATVRAR